ncbi:MAG TPA: protein translocase subunit SecD [Gemmatimonadaceae bacterium]|nr:protein translocase subunit SecD [Gemmatimonadaceae bacterium]
MSNLKYRIGLIVALCVLAIWALFPRNVKVRQFGADGVPRDVIQRHVPLRKGLDLQGGTYLALEVDESKQAIPKDKIPDAIERALKTVRNRIEGIGVSESVVQSQGNDRIVVQIPGIQDPERARQIVQEQAFLEFRITDKTQALERVLPRFDQIIKDKGLAANTAGAASQPQQPAASKGLQGLLTSTDTAKSKKDSASKKDTTKKDSTAVAALPTGGAFSSLIQQSPGGMPGEYLVESDNASKVETYLALPEIKAAMPPGKQMLPSNDSTVMQNKVYKLFYVVDAKPIVTGESLVDARPNTSPLEGTIVQFTLDNLGGRRFKTETGRHVHDYMAIVLDGRVMGRPPVIQSAIGTNGQITMGQGRDIRDAQDLALVLRAGALPVPLRVAEVRNIGPSLGQDSISKGFRAGAIAISLVVFIMLFYYRFSGVLAVAALALYVLYTLAILAGFDAVLTLPGLAGFVLSIGIAVDANVLIFERIREELDRGKTVRTAIDEGFRHARPAIIDSNVSTILTAAVLYQYGTGPVKGFAVTLIAGIAASLFTAIFVVRTFYIIWLNRSRGAQTLSI